MFVASLAFCGLFFWIVRNGFQHRKIWHFFCTPETKWQNVQFYMNSNWSNCKEYRTDCSWLGKRKTFMSSKLLIHFTIFIPESAQFQNPINILEYFLKSILLKL